MTVVDVRTIKGNDVIHFLFHRLPHSLDTKNGKNFTDVVRVGSYWVHVTFTEDLHQTCTVSFQQPLGNRLVLSSFCDHYTLLVVSGWQVHVHFGDTFNALKSHVTKHVSFNAS